MRTEQLDYELPPELIAQRPAQVRSESRLLVLDRSSGRLMDSRFYRIGEFLRPGDCLVLNDTKVLLARFFIRRQNGTQLEGLFLTSSAPRIWDVLIRGIRKLRTGETFSILTKDRSDPIAAQLVGKTDQGTGLIQIQTEDGPEVVLGKVGFPPLPPYIKRDSSLDTAREDQEHYQTVYAENPGAIAAPTAGLHFTQDLISQLRLQGIEFVRLTLHVGTGTFKPVTADNLADHPIHTERVIITSQAAETVNRIRRRGGRIAAVGTTSTRALESAALQTSTGWEVQPFEGHTKLFITPGHTFRIVETLITNFHLPRSTLLALVAAFAGLDTIMAAYRHAVRERYRFYSYGDAMLIL